MNARKGTGLHSSDLVCLYSDYWQTIAADIYELSGYGDKKDYYRKTEKKVAFTGSPQFDQFNRIDPLEVRKRWNIPQSDPVVLLLPIPISNLSDYWSTFFATENRAKRFQTLLLGGIYENPRFVRDHYWWIIKNWNESRLNQAISQFTINNNGFLLVKGREKDPIKPMLLNSANKIIYDDSYYPATIFEAFSIANLCIHFYSTATLEAAYAGVPSLCIHRPSPFSKYNTRIK